MIVKVTITVESEDQTVTHTIHQARNISTETNAIVIREGVRPREYMTSSLGFNLGLIADWDEQAGNIMSTLTTKKGQPIEKNN